MTVGALVMTLATARVERRALLIGLVGLFTLGNFMPESGLLDWPL